MRFPRSAVIGLGLSLLALGNSLVLVALLMWQGLLLSRSEEQIQRLGVRVQSAPAPTQEELTLELRQVSKHMVFGREWIPPLALAAAALSVIGVLLAVDRLRETVRAGKRPPTQ